MAESKALDDMAPMMAALDARFASTDIGVLEDDSTSEGWAEENPPANPAFGTCWNEQTNAVQMVVDQATLVDKDGVDYSTINTNIRESLYNGCNIDAFKEERGLRPNGGTHSWTALRREIDEWLKKYDKAEDKSKVKDYILIFFTDGQPGSSHVAFPEAKEHVFQTIVYLHEQLSSRGLGRKNFSIQMVQVGKDAKASEFLRQCDDELATRTGGVDYVDTTKYDASAGPLQTRMATLKILYGSAAADLDGGALEKVAAAFVARHKTA